MSDAYNHVLDLYHRFVGRFLTKYATVEALLRYLLRVQCGLTDAQFDILIGFPRTNDLITKTRKIANLNLDAEGKAAIADCFDQLDNITKIRDQIVHYGGYPLVSGEIVVRLKPTELSAETEKPHDIYGQSELEAAASDLDWIHQILLNRLTDGVTYRVTETSEPLTERLEPWRYKPRERLNRQKQSPDRTPERPPRRRS